MDKNKLKKLIEEEYTINQCCNFCAHAVFKPSKKFGTCSIKTYNHEKHNDTKRDLSIYIYGKCKNGFTLAPAMLWDLESYSQFFK